LWEDELLAAFMESPLCEPCTLDQAPLEYLLTRAQRSISAPKFHHSTIEH